MAESEEEELSIVFGVRTREVREVGQEVREVGRGELVGRWEVGGVGGV